MIKGEKVIINPTIARQLLKKGNAILDIKANKNAKRETVFVFENNEKLSDDIKEIVQRPKEVIE